MTLRPPAMPLSPASGPDWPIACLHHDDLRSTLTGAPAGARPDDVPADDQSWLDFQQQGAKTMAALLLDFEALAQHRTSSDDALKRAHAHAQAWNTAVEALAQALNRPKPPTQSRWLRWWLRLI